MAAEECRYCSAHIAVHSPRIKCADAYCPNLSLCLPCFASGVEMGRHDRSHGYHVLSNLTLPVLGEPWGADEEILLVESIRLFGLGNWADVSDHVGTKSPDDCESHYVSVFLSAPPPDGEKVAVGHFSRTNAMTATSLSAVGLPDVASATGKCGCHRSGTPARGSSPADGTERRRRARDSSETCRPGPLGQAGGPRDDFRGANSSGGGPSQGAKAVGVHSQPQDEASGEPGSIPSLAGFLPLRGDFDVEHDNDAELILADMEFSEREHRAERRLKLQIVHIYNYKLKVRRERKQFAIDRGLLDFRFRQAIERRRPKDEREIYNKMRVFARFQTAEEHENFVQGLIREQRIRKRIRQLQNYRSHGICTLLESEEFERDKKRHCADHECGERPAGRVSFSGEEEVGCGAAVLPVQTRTQSSNGHSANGTPTNDTMNDGLAGGKEVHVDTGISLGSSERKICHALQLTAKQYVLIKDALIRESVHLGFLSRKLLGMLVKINVNKTGKLYDFFARCGWVELL